MEQTQLSLDRPATPSNEPNGAEGSDFGHLQSQYISVSDIGISSASANDDTKHDFISSQVGNEITEAVDHKENLVAENLGESHLAKTELDLGSLSLTGSESSDGQNSRNMKMESKTEAGEVGDLVSANSTPSFEEDSISLSRNSDTRPTTSEGETSSGKDDCDLLLTDVLKSGSVMVADVNGADHIEEQQWRENSTLDEKETAFTDNVVSVSELESASDDRILNKDGTGTTRESDQHSSKWEVDENQVTNEVPKAVAIIPAHFQKKFKSSELSATPPKKTHKRKVGSTKLCAQAGETERGAAKSHLVPNGLCKFKDAARVTKVPPVEEHIVTLDIVGSGKKEDRETKSDRVSVCVENSDCESETSSLSEDTTCWLEKFRFVRKHLLTLAMALSLIFGVILGTCLRDSISYRDQRRILYLRFPGEILVNILHMLVIPLTLSTLVSTVAAMDTRSFRKLGLRSLFYYLITTFIAIVTGIILAMAAQPGKFDQLSGTGRPIPEVNPVDAVLDVLRNIFPDNIIVACFRKFTTEQVKINRWPEVSPTSSVSLAGTSEFELESYSLTPYLDDNSTNVVSSSTSSGNSIDTYSTPVTLDLLPETFIQVNNSELFSPLVTQTDGTNFLGLILASVVMGAVISSMGQQGRPLHDFFGALSIVSIKITRIVILYSPVGIFFLVAANVVEVEFPQLTFYRLLMYTITVLVGLLGHGFVILPLVYFLMTRKNPIPFVYGISQGIITALATSSSAATLPIMLRCLERKNQVSSHVARFVAPVGAVINLNGTALYQAMACIFIAQHRAVDLTVSQMALMSLIATLGSIGASCIPQSGLLTLVAMLTSVGLPQEDAALILTVDWILDRVSTMVNVVGDAIGAGLLSHLAAKEEARKKGFNICAL